MIQDHAPARGAERRKAHHPTPRAASTSVAACRACAVARQKRYGARSPSGASLRHSPRRANAVTQLQNRVSWDLVKHLAKRMIRKKARPGLDPEWQPVSRKDHAQTIAGVLPALTCPSPVSSSQTGRRAGRAGPPGAARERGANPRAGTALAPHSGLPSGRRPSSSENWSRNRNGDVCQGWSRYWRPARCLNLSRLFHWVRTIVYGRERT